MQHAAIAAGATLVSLAFALCTLDRWLDRRRPHELVWTISLLLFAAGSLGLWLGAAVGWNELTFKVFYLFGAILNVPFLALGTVYLLARKRRTGDRWTVAVTLLSAFAAGIVTEAPLTRPIDPAVLPQGKEVFGAAPRILAAAGSGIAATVIITGAAWSAARLLLMARRNRRAGAIQFVRPGTLTPRRLALANILIATGTLVSGAAGLFNQLDQMDAFAICLLAGISVIFAGFLLTNTAKPVEPWYLPAARSSPGPAGIVPAGQAEASTG